MRAIREGKDFAQCVERLGGYRAIDRGMEPILDGLMRNPFGFKFFENDWCRLRYAKTEPIEDIVPGLIVIFTIDENNDVTLEWVEEDIPF
jgi:hypothetical protein